MNATAARASGVRRWYFPGVSALLLALTLIAFSDNLVTNVGQKSNFDPKFVIHGLFCLAWMVVLVIQASLIAQRHQALHRRLGPAMLLVAMGVTLSTLYVFWVNWPGWPALDAEAKANRLLLPSYAIAIWLAYRARRRPDRHRRLVLIGSFYMLGPVIARTFDPLIVPITASLPVAVVDAMFPPYFAGLWIALLGSLWGYDLYTVGHIHRVTGWGSLWLGAVWRIALAG